MKKGLFFLLIASFALVGTSLEAGPLKQWLGIGYDISETVKIDPPQLEDAKWKLRDQMLDNNNGLARREWIPARDNKHNPTRLFTVAFVNHRRGQTPLSAKQQVHQMIQGYSQLPCSPYIQILEQSEHDVLELLCWEHGQPQSVELMRIITTQRGMHIIGCTKYYATAFDPYEMHAIVASLKSACVVR